MKSQVNRELGEAQGSRVLPLLKEINTSDFGIEQDGWQDGHKNSQQTIIYSKIAELGKQIEDIEETVITYNIKRKEITVDKKSNISKEIEKILQDWTLKIQDRYKSVGDVEAEEAQSLVLEVIKRQGQNSSKISLAEAVNDTLQEKIKIIDSPEYKQIILHEALNKFDKNAGLSNSRTEVGKGEIEAIIQETSSLLVDKDKSELNLLNDTDKFKLLIGYKTIEFSKLQLLVYDIKEKILDSSNPISIEEISTELQNSENANVERIIELKEQYIQLCTKKIINILEELQNLENKFDTSSGLSHLTTAMIGGIEQFSSNNYTRHIFYNQIFDQLKAKTNSIGKLEKISEVIKSLNSIKQNIVSEQWKNFVQGQKIENVSNEEGIILSILDEYCISENDSLNIEELAYYIDNMIEFGKLTGQNIYTRINNLNNTVNSKVTDNKRDKINSLKAFILSKVDQIELEKIKKLFEDRINYQEKQYKDILEIKNSITKKFSKYCGILDKSNKENYTKVIKLYLDKLDRLVAAGNAEDISYSKRKEVFVALNQSITNIIAKSALKDQNKAECIESEISKEINKLAFDISHTNSDILSTDILEHLNKVIDCSSERYSNYKRSSKTLQTIKLEDLFDNSGKIKEKQGKEVFWENKTVIVNIDQEEYYRLSEDINSLKKNQSTYKESIEEYKQELSIQYKRYKLVQLKSAINIYNSNKNIKHLVDITRGLIYYLSLQEEHLEVDKTFENSIHKFLSSYHNTIKHLMIHERGDQDIISELRIAIDFFNEDVIKERKINNKDEGGAEKALKSLRNTLIYKTYKEPGFKLFTEEENQFQQQLALNNLLQEKLNEIIQVKIPEIMWLRGIIIPQFSKAFFESLSDLITRNLPEQLVGTSKDGIDCIQTFINQEKNKMVLDGLVDEKTLDNVEDFITKITTKELSWQTIFLNQGIVDQHKLQKLSLIIQEYHAKFAQEDLEGLILELAKKKASVDIESFLMLVLRLYANKILDDQANTLRKNYKEETIIAKLSISLELEIINAFNVWQVGKNTQRKKTYQDFIDHLKQLRNCVLETSCSEDNIKEIDSLEQKEIRFITDILDISELELNSRDVNNIISTKLDTQQKDEDKITYLKLLLQLPDSFYSNKIDYKNFVTKLVQNVQDNRSEQGAVELNLYYYIREHVYKYYDLFLDQILDITEDIDQRKSDIQEALQRLYENLSVTDFIKYAIKLLTNDDDYKEINFIIKTYKQDQRKINGVDLGYILPFLYSEEKEHLKALLSFEKTEPEATIANSTENDNGKTLDEAIVKLLQYRSKQSTTNIISKLKRTFTEEQDPPILMWVEELIDLRLNAVRDLILSKISYQDHGTNKIGDILDAFRFFHDEKGNLDKALDTLDLICKNINKFSTLEEIKQFIYSLLHIDDFTIVNHIIKSSDKKNIILDLLFSQIVVENNKKLKNAIDKLKFILSNSTFEEINYFCKIFFLQVCEQQNLDNLPIIIDLIIESKAYINRDFLRNLQDKDMSLWNSFLKKTVMLNELNTTIFCKCSNKNKNKIVDLLYQMKDEKGGELQQILFNKIKNLDETDKDSCNIRKLNFILNKIIYKPYKDDAIEQLPQKLNEWEKILFANDESKGKEILSIKQLLGLMNKEDKIASDGINESIKFCLDKIERKNETLIEQLLTEAKNLNKKSKFYNSSKNINEWQEQEIKEWARIFKSKSSSEHDKMFSWKDNKSTETISEVISVIIRAVIIYDHYPKGPRDTQLISLLLFLDCNNIKGRLGNVYTGEGKTLITIMLATCLGLLGKRVDVVTSSKVLAIRDSQARASGTKEGYKGFFKMFDLHASNNCDEECEKPDTGEDERKSRYQNCSIIYGEVGYFQRDILLSQFFSKNIRGGHGIGDVLILDEVDSMMIDNAAKTLYISHNITDMRHLKDIFIHIWAAVNSQEERYYSEDNVQKIIKYINKIINTSDVRNYSNTSSQEDDLKVMIPSTLYDFVQMNLKTWIESAYDAKYIGEDNAYIIGDEDSQKQNEVIIMDKDTGVEQTSTKWSNGLHQFIQLKHSSKLSDESLKAVYISNVGYFQKYQNLYGMTGTVGGIEERKLLRDVYGIDFFEIPRFKTHRFEYDFESESIAGTPEEWLQNIIENIDENMDQQLIYTKEYISLMTDKLHKEQQSLDQLIKNYTIQKNEKEDLEQQKTKCVNKIKIFKDIERISDETIEICEKPLLNKFKTDMNRIHDQINILRESCGDSDQSNTLDKILDWITEISSSNSEYEIEQFGTKFNNNIKRLDIADLNNKEKEKLEKLNVLINKIQEEIDYIDADKIANQTNLAFYKQESQVKPGSKKTDSRRAVLIICDNIADLKYIEEKVRKKFNNHDEYELGQYKIYKYDRAYQKFDISRLEAGDIVIATNIAGRGTDLKVSKQVKVNGGLHVILSYIPKNFRIEKQAFGRTARAGNQGTATYIVFDPRKQSEDIDISQLKKERNELETDRLAIVQKEQLPKINLEDTLFAKFNKLRENIESKLYSFNLHQQSKSKDYLKLQIDSLKNQWAIWLNKMSDKFNKIHEVGNDKILREYEDFEREIKGKLNNKYGLIEEPGELNKLGRVYLDNKQYSTALDCFDYIINHHPSFASIALYYKAFCIIHKEGGGFDAKVKVKVALKESLRMLEDDRSRVLSRNQILKTINEVARAKGMGLDSNCFAKQNEGEAQILSVHINAINSAIGSEISPDCFNTFGIVGDQAQKVYDQLLKNQYDIIKDFRISKKCFIGSKVLIKDQEKQKQVLEEEKNKLARWVENYKELPKTSTIHLLQSLPYVDSKIYDDAIRFITRHNEDYITFDAEHQSHSEIFKILEDVKIISQRQIFKKTAISSLRDLVATSELIEFPDVFYYCKEQVLDNLKHSLINSQKKSWWYKEREKKPESFESFIYTKKNFTKDTASLVKVEEVIRIAADIKQKLLGKLDHQIFCKKGDQIKNILTSSLLSIDHKFLKQRFRNIKNESIFFGKKAEIEDFCLGRQEITLSDGQIIALLDNQLFTQNDIVSAISKIINLSKNPSPEDKTSFDILLHHLFKFNNLVIKNQLVKLIRDKTLLQDEQINKILTHLEKYTQLTIDHKFLKQKFRDIKNESIFFGKKSEIQDFCLGRRKITLSDGKIIYLLDNQLFAQDDIVRGLKKIINLSKNPSPEDKTSFDALMIQLDFDVGKKFEAINSYNQYSLKDYAHLDKIKEYLEIINLKDSSNDENTKSTIEQLDFSVDSRLTKKSNKIIYILKSKLGTDKPLKKEDFQLAEEAFEILRAILIDANIINTSIFNLLTGERKEDNINPVLEAILIRIYQAGGVITDQDIVLKDKKEASQELFNRLRELHIIKPPKINFKLGRAKYVPEFLGGNTWKDSSDPAKKMEYIKAKIEQVVHEVFGLTTQDDTGHQINQYVTGGIGSESKNKELDEKIEVITNIIKHVAGTIKTLPEIKVESKDLRTMFSEGKVPPELIDYIHICFDAVLEYKEDKGFDWDCFLCAIIGLAQIVAGIALEVLSGGSAHFIAQALIAEGVGDIVFAIQAGIEGNFSWKSYGQHKVQSLMISLITAGVGSFLSKGAQTGKMAVGLATKTAITKAIMKTVIVESCTAVITATVNVGTEEISQLLIEEIANTHFVQYFANWTKEDSAYNQKIKSIENKLTGLYNRFGTTIAKQIIDTCIESSLHQMISGVLGDKIFAQISCVVENITKAFSMVSRRLGKGNSKAKLLGTIASCVEKTVKVTEFSKNFAQLCNISNDFYDHLIMELNKLEVSLIEQQKNGTLKIDENQIAEEKVLCSFSGEVSKDVRMVQEKMHVAFKSKIQNGFLQPAVSSLLHMAVKPIQQIIAAPFTNAMDQLKGHIDSRAEMFQESIMHQHADRVLPITARQKKALELRDEIIKIENIKDPSFLKAEVTNFVGETLENLQKEHGANLHVMIKNGNIYAVLPTYKQLCDNIQSGNLKLAGELHIKMAATQVGREIEVVSANIDDSKTLIHHEKGPGIVKPIGASKSKNESYKIAFIEGENGNAGHYTPVIEDQDGNWKVIRDIDQIAKTKDACFGQTMAFLKEYEKTGSLESAKACAENPSKVAQYNKSLGKFAKHNKAIKAHYLQGTTVKSNRIVGGADVSGIEKKLANHVINAINTLKNLNTITSDNETKKTLEILIAKEQSILDILNKINPPEKKDANQVNHPKKKAKNEHPDKNDKNKINLTRAKKNLLRTILAREFVAIESLARTELSDREYFYLESLARTEYLDEEFVAIESLARKKLKLLGTQYDEATLLRLKYNNAIFLRRQYNDNIHPIAYSVQFSQKGVNAFFSADTTSTRFPFAAKSVPEVGKMKPFPTEEFRINVFLHPYLSGVIVADNNRGLTAHAMARVPLTRIQLTDDPSNYTALQKTIDKNFNGRSIWFDKNLNKLPSEVRHDLKIAYPSNKISLEDNPAGSIQRLPTDPPPPSQPPPPSLSGSNLKQFADITWIDSYFSKYTLDAIESILELRINNLGLKEVKIARGYIFQKNYNNLQEMIYHLTDTKSGIILAPLNLYNKHAVGIMGVKEQDNGLRLYYIDPSNETIPDRFKQIFIDNGLQIEQLPTEQQKYANCGPEVIENFILYLTGERLSQEESIVCHSKLIEQKLVSKANNLDEAIDSRYSRDLEKLDSSYDNDDSEKVDQEEVPLGSVDIDIKSAPNIPCLTKHSASTFQTTDFENKNYDTNNNDTSISNKNTAIDDNDTIREQNAFAAYAQGNLLSNEAWEDESDEYNDRSVEAEQKFAKSLELYKVAVELSPTNIAYKHALDITSLKIEGNNSFSEGVALVNIAYDLQEEANELADDQEVYQEVLNHYQQALEFYKAAQASFHEGWYLSKDTRLKSCIEIVQDSIGLIQKAITEIQAEVDSESIEKNDVTDTNTYLTRDPIELFKQDDQDYILNDYLMGNIAQETYYM
ncbi:MAG: hypothetical protein LF885_07155 (plasmid) [Rickettsia endosymbiont of Culicoides impunctatus]|nr:MAG: hypothetical protein LF885_07155 [Rickettsia endosymbiont of Culicoides impunctatus]